jgi:predicted MFS family arabinose efflux permease
MGLVAMSVPLGSSAMSLIYQFFVTHHGWRSAFLALGIALWILVVIPGAIFLRRQPEDLGLIPDGLAGSPLHDSPLSLGKERQEKQPERSWTRRSAMRTSALWLLVASTFLASVGTGGIAFHVVAYLTDNQIPPGVAAGALSLMALSGAMGNGLWGALAERLQPRRLNVATMIISAGAVVLLMQLRSPFMAYIFAVLFGLNARGAAVLTLILLARYFGRSSYGAITSVLDPFHKGGLGLGALLAGIAFDLTGNYQTIFAIFLGSYLLSALLIFLARRPAAEEEGLKHEAWESRSER